MTEEKSLSEKEAYDLRQEKTPASYFNNSTIIAINLMMTHRNLMKSNLPSKAPLRCRPDSFRVTFQVRTIDPKKVVRGNHSSAMETSWRYTVVVPVIKSAKKAGVFQQSHNHIITYISPFSLKDHQMCALANIVK